MPLAPNQQLFEYRVVRVLGQGAFGTVYLAHDTLLDRPVAIKELAITSQTDEVALKRFIREARTAGGLNHPHIVTVYALKVVENDVYLVMEYLPGGNLRTSLETHGPAPVEVVVCIAAEVCEGLAAAHARGIVHRDVKPENILLTGDGRAKVGDFGIAHVPQAMGRYTMTATGFQPGTLVYMSPEQIRGQQVDGWSDVYQVGALLYEMLTGRHYVDMGALSQRARQTAGSNVMLFQARLYELLSEVICEREPDGVCMMRPDVPHWVGQVVAAALAKRVDERPTAEELARLLHNGVSLHARPAALKHQLMKVMRKTKPADRTRRRMFVWRWVLGMLAMLALLLLGGRGMWVAMRLVITPTSLLTKTPVVLTETLVPISVSIWTPTYTPLPTATRTAIPTHMPIYTPTRTPTRMPAHTPTPTPAISRTTVRSNLRAGPDTTFDVLTVLEPDTAVTPIERTPDGVWWHVSVADRGSGRWTGWIHASLLSPVQGLASIPTATWIPPSPAPERASTSQPTPTPMSEPSSAGPSEYQTKYFVLSIEGPTMRAEALLGQHVQEEAEGIYLIVPVQWRNTSLIPRYNFADKPWTCVIVSTRFSGCESYDVFATSAYYDTQGQYFSRERKLAPREILDGWLVFDIPESLTSPVLRVYFDDLGSEVVAEVPLQ